MEPKKIDGEVAKMLLKTAPKYRIAVPVFALKMEFPFSIDTPEGEMTGEIGDYLAGDADGNYFRLKAEHFEAKYKSFRERKAETKPRKTKGGKSGENN